jgi:hypothetical protein
MSRKVRSSFLLFAILVCSSILLFVARLGSGQDGAGVAVDAVFDGGDDGDEECFRVDHPPKGDGCEAWRVENARGAELLARAMEEEDARAAATLRAPRVLPLVAERVRAAVSRGAPPPGALPVPSAGAEQPARPRSMTRLEPAKKRAKVSVLLFTVTFYANLAHNLTRSP